LSLAPALCVLRHALRMLNLFRFPTLLSLFGLFHTFIDLFKKFCYYFNGIITIRKYENYQS
jgi:hypothetical protein